MEIERTLQVKYQLVIVIIYIDLLSTRTIGGGVAASSAPWWSRFNWFQQGMIMSEMPTFLVFLRIPFHCWLDHRERLFKRFGKDMSLLVGNILFEHTRKLCRSSSRNMFAQGFPSLIVGRRIMFYIELFRLACRSLNCTIDTEPWT